jgi:hypothetical protein|tara:strand:- start:38 stop:166 length:129 start_codon:yes stop_codon:yes gene_type:complete
MEERLTIDSTAVQSFLKASIHTKGIGTISPKQIINEHTHKQQ